MMSKHRWIQLWISGVLVVGLVSCTLQSLPLPVDGNTLSPLQAPTSTVVATTPAQKPTRPSGVEASPLTGSPRQWAAPIAPGETITKEKAMSSSTPIPPPLDYGLQSFVRQAQEDLAKRLAVPVDQIELVEVRDVVWPDKGLGCPQPGMAYAQVLVEGLLIRLRAGGQLYAYHSGGSRPPFLCERPAGSAPGENDVMPPPGSGSQ